MYWIINLAHPKPKSDYECMCCLYSPFKRTAVSHMFVFQTVNWSCCINQTSFVCIFIHLFFIIPDGASSILLQSCVVATSASVWANMVPHLHRQKNVLKNHIQNSNLYGLNRHLYSTLPSLSPQQLRRQPIPFCKSKRNYTTSMLPRDYIIIYCLSSLRHAM